jgi:hypothetical protein
MPTMRIKEVRLPELHLPEMSRDDITRAIGDATRDIDLTRLDPRRVDLPEVAADLSRELSKIDLPKAVASAATVGRPQRSRLPFVIGGLITLGLVAFAVASSPILRPRLEAAAKRARERFEEMRAERMATESGEDARAFDAAVAVPIEPAAFSADAPTTDSPFDGSAPLPDGFGAAVADQSPAVEDATRA